MLHLHPRVVPAAALRFSLTFGLGGAALVLFLLLALSGALLLVAYEPSPERAYGTVAALVDQVHFGAFIRNIHHWAANGLVLVTGLHLLRVFYRGGHLPPRRGNWIVGVLLLLLVVASAFTGYLLPWDQLAYWAVTISTGMLEYVPWLGSALMRAARGGPEIGPTTLARFFVLHVAILPIALLLLLAFHFWLVRKAGGVILPVDVGDAAAPRGPLVPTSPGLTQREGVAALVVLATVLMLAAVANAPLQAQANPGMSPNPAKAPWYFMGVQELLVHVHPLYAAVVVPLAALVLLFALPALAGGERPSGRWFESARGARLALGAALAGALLAALAIVVNEPLRHGPPWIPALPPAVRGGLLPVLAAVGLAVVAGVVARRRGANRIELIQAVFSFVLAAFVVLTVTGVLFRGQGMALTWPWTPPG
ncbi:MAG: cytochrome b N-terminal domain-containing protein [Acidobacteria bacterium]|nr:cytochrome b N-terminal domain-containing protein [Acidobacteriota bacterium]MCU0253313.1 cytochrome b N-terminal domain-containing protein [Acidobacteriota bacterium]